MSQTETETETTDDPPPSPPEATIHQRMIAILAELPAIGKDSRNTQQNFNFRSHDDVLNALNPLLAKHGVYLVPEVVERERLDTRTTGQGKTMYEVNLLVRYTFYGESGDSISASAWGEGTDMGDKSTNKAMTMAFKNVLAQAFAVSTSETVDTDRESPEETTTRGGGSSNRPDNVPVADEADVEYLRKLAALCDVTPDEVEKLLTAARANNWGELSPDYIANQVKGLEKKVGDRAKRARTAIEGLVGDLEAGGMLAPGDVHWFDFFHTRTPIADLTLEQGREVVPILRKPGVDSATLAAALEGVIGGVRAEQEPPV
jgi:hypothetical protein